MDYNNYCFRRYNKKVFLRSLFRERNVIIPVGLSVRNYRKYNLLCGQVNEHDTNCYLQ